MKCHVCIYFLFTLAMMKLHFNACHCELNAVISIHNAVIGILSLCYCNIHHILVLC